MKNLVKFAEYIVSSWSFEEMWQRAVDDRYEILSEMTAKELEETQEEYGYEEE